jgi:hypothetical protein
VYDKYLGPNAEIGSDKDSEDTDGKEGKDETQNDIKDGEELIKDEKIDDAKKPFSVSTLTAIETTNLGKRKNKIDSKLVDNYQTLKSDSTS